MTRAMALAVLVLAACAKETPVPAPGATVAVPLPEGFRSISPNAFYAGGTPTFVNATGGDARADRDVRAQIEVYRQILFPAAEVIDDSAVGDAPVRPVVYGGPHINTWLAKLAPHLPFEMDAGELVIGGKTFTGEDLRLITVVPARTREPAHPEFLVYAGTGSPGISEINSTSKGAEQLLVADAFGPLYTGRWVAGPDGPVAKLETKYPRISWREVAGKRIAWRFPEELAPAENEAEVIAAGERGVEQAIARLGLSAPARLTFYVHPDVRSKQSLTSKAGDGHAVASARVLHIIGRGDAAAIEGLVAHEATHVLAYDAYGPAGSGLMGEGLAVWVAGRYGGVTLDEWRTRLAGHVPVNALLGVTFFRTPEPKTYPVAGNFVAAAVELVGVDKVVAHLYGATVATWDAACVAAGTTAAALDEALAKRLAPPPPPGP